MNTRYKKHLEAFKNTVVSVVSSMVKILTHKCVSTCFEAMTATDQLVCA